MTTLTSLHRTACAALALSAAVALPGQAWAEEIRILNWADYFDPDVIAEFQEETGITVILDTYTENDVGEATLLAMTQPYDLAVTSLDAVGRLRAGGAILPLASVGLDTTAPVMPEVATLMTALDPDYAQHAFLYLWGHTGLVVNEEAILSRVPEAPMDSWQLIFDPVIVESLADCGVGIVDSAEEVLAAALSFMGQDPHLDTAEGLAPAFDRVRAIAPYLSKIDSSHYDALLEEELCLALTWTTEGLAAEFEVEDSPYSYVTPVEGTNAWFDVFVVPTGMQNPDALRQFVDYIQTPENAAWHSEWGYAASGDPAARAETSTELAQHPAMYPDLTQGKVYPLLLRDSASKAAIDRTWRRALLGL